MPRTFIALVLLLGAAGDLGWSFTPSFSGAGTEIRSLVSQDGRVFAGNGYWKDGGNAPGAQVLVLDGPGRPWRIDHTFDELVLDGRRPGGRRRHLAIGAMAGVTFRSDRRGAALPAPVSMLLASTWDITGRRTVFARDGRSGAWSGTVLAEDRPHPPFLPQIRAFGFHRDTVTGADLAFAGDTRGIFSGWYEDGVQWNRAPEMETAESDAPGLGGRMRISSFAEAEGHLFAAVGQQVWERRDGAAPDWTLRYTNPHPFYSQTGLRGLTAVTGPRGMRLLAAVEGNHARIVNIDPDTGAGTTDLDVAAFLNAAWGTRVSYVIAGYNDMTRIPGTDDLLIGIEAFIPPASPRPAGHVVLDVLHGLEAGGWFLVRHKDGQYELHRVTTSFPGIGEDLVSVRTIVGSPFAGDAGVFYFGGYDANDAPAHDSGWIARVVAGR